MHARTANETNKTPGRELAGAIGLPTSTQQPRKRPFFILRREYPLMNSMFSPILKSPTEYGLAAKTGQFWGCFRPSTRQSFSPRTLPGTIHAPHLAIHEPIDLFDAPPVTLLHPWALSQHCTFRKLEMVLHPFLPAWPRSPRSAVACTLVRSPSGYIMIHPGSMAISGAEDDPLASISCADVSVDDECFSDDGGNETDCTSVCDEGKDGLPDVLEGDCFWLLRDLADALKDDGDWLCNKEEHLPEHYLEEEDNLNPSCLQ
ncbi:hypothetical protein CISG_09751 [Coccidioides immitis RMSCC 3703]|uniref:Uncharacterized protein n=2 Tax=Coccidioides immitis TaxID=5501 RepID=A0A0J8QN74_COCIT|nr:hypothetical protein CIRG_07953 [Coccidioides immitis RMSCC 2394]KMU72658.1 hypothetical protein CISG_09751 [Coccidioides immitis RMSCC 3703]